MTFWKGGRLAFLPYIIVFALALPVAVFGGSLEQDSNPAGTDNKSSTNKSPTVEIIKHEPTTSQQNISEAMKNPAQPVNNKFKAPKNNSDKEKANEKANQNKSKENKTKNKNDYQKKQHLASAQRPSAAPLPSRSATSLSNEESVMLSMINKERAASGLTPLKSDSALTRLARLKAKDMIDGGYFNHQSPTYGSPFDMMNSAGVSYKTAGENLAGASSVGNAHKNLMNSPGHRANILNGAFNRVGIGVVSGGPYGKMFVQMFIG